jgi:hypothetical protein
VPNLDAQIQAEREEGAATYDYEPQKTNSPDWKTNKAGVKPDLKDPTGDGEGPQAVAIKRKEVSSVRARVDLSKERLREVPR